MTGVPATSNRSSSAIRLIIADTDGRDTPSQSATRT